MNITEYLEKQGVKHHLKGFALLHTAIEKAEPGFSMMQLYADVAKLYGLEQCQVERNMRTAVHSTGNKITTMEFIARAVWYLQADAEEPRICSNCKQKMVQGYVIGDGEEYYCSDECLSGYYSEEEYDELCQKGLAYWTNIRLACEGEYEQAGGYEWSYACKSYDVEAVVRKLEEPFKDYREKSENMMNHRAKRLYYRGLMRGFEYAIEIVRGGRND